ncbi:FHA domain-containing protein [Rhodoferax sp.]|uniref:FHA domain-containing protein n=1 Tax=Rhodoferax sp. TaxID=50421 RepID=UPI0019F1A388|nr:FHA domain-containing protein [Rhodoferax sp.]MBE0475081.1 FHA domain-containing protein [Rhodoferax sp.]
MPKITIKLGSDILQEVQLTKERTTLGRRPYSDVVMENMAVSGQHACLVLEDQHVSIEDLHSTNGTYVNGSAVKKQALQDGDVIEIGNFTIKFSANSGDVEDRVEDQEGLSVNAGLVPTPPASPVEPAADLIGRIKVIAGPAVGRELRLTKIVTTFGKPGVAVAAITRREQSYFVHLVGGADAPMLNGSPVGQEPRMLSEGDQITLSGTVLQFSQC